MDVRMTHDAARRAIAHARDGKGPYILEMLTYRYRGHSMSDPAKYRSKDEVTTMRAERDPIEQIKSRILEKRYGTEESLKAVETEVRALITEAADFATSDAEPAPSELWTDIYAEA
jgi:pyruvate dehydrogenase E1 component alpha subunit